MSDASQPGTHPTDQRSENETSQSELYPVLREFEAASDFPFDPFQRTACEQLEAGQSVLVAAPTGSGKTTVAEFAVALARREYNARIFYTAPIKALSNQKFRELCDEYGEDEVGLLTGDVNIRGDAPIVVMTTEVLRNMIYAESDALQDLAFVVLDEVHFLGDRHRGAVWEEIILHLPQSVRLVSLSATVSNAEEFGDWMHAVRGNTDVVLSEHRPVPLYQHVLTQRALLPLYVDREGDLAERGKVNPDVWALERHRGGRSRERSRGRAPQRSRSRISRADIVRALDETGLTPAIIFVFSRVGCDQAVRQCMYEGLRLTSREERREIREVIEREIASIPDEDLRVLGVRDWIAGLECGFAAHHAGLLPQFKAVVEELFQRRLIKVVFATETLALGINMPAKCVVIEKLEKFNGEERVPLTSGEYTQLTGRAGRRGIDTEGHAIVVWDDRLDVEAVSHLGSARSFPVKSIFRPTANMAVNLLQRMDIELVRETLELSFAQFQADRAVVDQARAIRAEQDSLASYRSAAERSTGQDRARWQDRERKLRRKIERGRRQVAAKTGTIARTFDRVVDTLLELEYLERHDGGEFLVSAWGEILCRIYGDRDLLVAESLRRGVWDDLDSVSLAAMCCALTYEPRRDDDDDPVLPGGRFRLSFDETLSLWSELDDRYEQHSLPQPAMPHAGLAAAMAGWAQGWTLSRTLERSGLGAGDFVRWSKQTIDLLDQIAQAAEHSMTDVDRLGAIARVAREAKKRVRRGIVETASVA